MAPILDPTLSETHGEVLSKSDLPEHFHQFFENTVQAHPERTALVSLWEQEDPELKAFVPPIPQPHPSELGSTTIPITVDTTSSTTVIPNATAPGPSTTSDTPTSTTSSDSAYPTTSLTTESPHSSSAQPQEKHLKTPGQSTPSIRWTYHQLNHHANVAASWLQSHGCFHMSDKTTTSMKVGNSALPMRPVPLCLVVLLWNSAEWAVFFWAAAKLGVPFVPLDPRTLSAGKGLDDVKYMLEATPPGAVVVQDVQAAGIVDQVFGTTNGTDANIAARDGMRGSIAKVCCCLSGGGVGDAPPKGWVTRREMAYAHRRECADGDRRVEGQLSAMYQDKKEQEGIPSVSTGTDCHDTTGGDSTIGSSCLSGGSEADSLSTSGTSTLDTTNFLDHCAAIGASNYPKTIPDTQSTTEDPIPTITQYPPTASPSLILYTSGTTSNPKPCPHSTTTLYSSTYDFDPNPAPCPPDRWLVHTPVSHIFATNNCLRAWRYGHVVVFPSRAFSVDASVAALVNEKCTFMSAVPTLVKAMVGHPVFQAAQDAAGDGARLRYVTIGGTIIREDDVRMCQTELGAESVVQGYGMSEGAPVVSWRRDDELFLKGKGWHPGVGKVLPGANMRICHPGSREVVQRGEMGELHIGGTSVISGYLTEVQTESFYEDDVGNWLATGDQASMDQDGVLFVHGRYKDLIIRGGENVSPTKIEAELGLVLGIAAQVVGAPDPVAGEMSVAVVKSTTPIDKTAIADAARGLGSIYALSHIILLSDLGLENFPMTPSGKVRKRDLKDVVARYLGGPSQPPQSTPPEDIGEVGELEHASLAAVEDELDSTSMSEAESEASTVTTSVLSSSPPQPTHDNLGAMKHKEPLDNLDTSSATHIADTIIANKERPAVATKEPTVLARLQDIWHDLTHTKPQPDDDLRHSSDSITVLRYCDRVLNELGVRIHLQDVLSNTSLRKQVNLIVSRMSGPNLVSEGDLTDEKHTSMIASAIAELTAPVPTLPIAASIRQSSVSTFMPTLLPFQAQSTAPVPSLSSPTHLTIAFQTLQALSLPGTALQDIIPIRPSLHRFIPSNSLIHRPQTYHTRLCYKLPRNHTPATVRQALEAAITPRSLFRTALCHGSGGSLPFHTIIAPSKELFSRLIPHQVLPSTSSLQSTLQSSDPSSFPTKGLTLQALIITTKSEQEEDTLYLRLTLNHTTYDALTLLPFYNDLNKLLSRSSWSPPPSPTFKIFADLISLYSASVPARESIRHHVRRLRGISRLESSLFPRQRAPGWMIADDTLSPLFPEREAVRRQVWGQTPEGEDTWTKHKFRLAFPRESRIVRLHPSYTFPSEKFLSFADVEKIKPQILLKAAVALTNMVVTGTSTALFSTIDSGRKWPFIPPWMEKVLPSTMDVEGPMLEWVVEVVRMPTVPMSPTISTSPVRPIRDARSNIHIRRTSAGQPEKQPQPTLASFLTTLTEEAAETSNHTHAPWDSILDSLGEDEARVANEAAVRQTLVWDVSLPLLNMAAVGMGGGGKQGGGAGDGYRNLVPVGRYDWPDSGLFWNACELDKGNIFLVASWDTAQMHERQVEGLVDGVADFLRRLSDPGNWDRTVEEMVGEHWDLAERGDFYAGFGEE